MRRPPPRTRIDVRRARDVYVVGRARNTTLEEKERRAARDLEPPSADPTDALPSGPPTYGVPVPERLDFHRGAGTWRERIAGLARRSS